MEERPLRLLSELRSPQHRPPMMAFALVAVACALVIATGIRFGPTSGVFPPFDEGSVGASAVVDMGHPFAA